MAEYWRSAQPSNIPIFQHSLSHILQMLQLYNFVGE